MDENCYYDAILIPSKTKEFKGLEYTLICKRKDKSAAEALKKDMVEKGKKCIITVEGGEFHVWWC